MKSIGCKFCRQEEDKGESMFEKKYNAGWLGEVQLSVNLENFPIVMNYNFEYHDNDDANLYLCLHQNYNDEPLIHEQIEIKFCPFCGANLKKVRDFMRSLEREEE